MQYAFLDLLVAWQDFVAGVLNNLSIVHQCVAVAWRDFVAGVLNNLSIGHQ